MKTIILYLIAIFSANTSYACSEFISNPDEVTWPSFLDIASGSKNVFVVKYVSSKFVNRNKVYTPGDSEFLPVFEVIRVIKGNIADKTILVDTYPDSCDNYSHRDFKINKEFVIAFREYKNVSTDKSIVINLWKPEREGVRNIENNSVSHVDIRTFKDKRKINISIDYLAKLIASDATSVPFKTQEEYNKSLKDAP